MNLFAVMCSTDGTNIFHAKNQYEVQYNIHLSESIKTKFLNNIYFLYLRGDN